MARIRKLDRSLEWIGPRDAQTQAELRQLHGWKVEMDEDVDYDLISRNPGPLEIRFVRCQPLAQRWAEDAYLDAPIKPNEGGKPAETYMTVWNPDNEDQFFIAQYKNTAGKWVDYDGGEGNANAEVTNNGNSCNLSWVTPSEVMLIVQAH